MPLLHLPPAQVAATFPTVNGQPVSAAAGMPNAANLFTKPYAVIIG